MPPTLLDETQRAACYKVLAQCYYAPDEQLLDDLRQSDDAGLPLMEELRQQAGTVDDLQAISIDHAKLFVGPYKLLAPPYGSIYLEDDKLMGESALDARRVYAASGLDIVATGPPDHISIEMEYLYSLVLKEAAAAQNSDSQAQQASRGSQQQFLAVHLGRWVGRFAERVQQHADTDFYRTLARLTREFIEAELAALTPSD